MIYNDRVFCPMQMLLFNNPQNILTFRVYIYVNRYHVTTVYKLSSSFRVKTVIIEQHLFLLQLKVQRI